MNPNEKASSVYLVDINSARKAILFSSPAAEQMTLEIIKSLGPEPAAEQHEPLSGERLERKIWRNGHVDVQAPPAEMSVLGSTACSWRRTELISPFNLTLCSWVSLPKPYPSPLPAAHGVPFPVWNAFPWVGWWDDSTWPGASRPPNPVFIPANICK